MYKAILSLKNIHEAYLDLVRKFDTESKSSHYVGVDGQMLNDFNYVSEDLLEQIREELIDLKPLLPTLEYEIPKPNGKKRQIFVYSVKDRIKAQAIFRILEPVFEAIYSPFLFSYRSSHPTYYAAKAVAKRYKKYFGEDTVFKADISKYTDTLSQKILEEKLAKSGFPHEVVSLLRLFIYNSKLNNNQVIYPEKGIMQGVPLGSAFLNFYLNDLDNVIGKKVSLYRRVGDDFIILDKDQKKVEMMKDFIVTEAEKIKLKISLEKTQIIKSNEPFSYVGYVFKDKKVSIREASIRKALIRWGKKLKYFHSSDDVKKSKINAIFYEDSDCIHNQFVQYIACYRQANDYDQIKSLFDEFLRILTKYFFKQYSEKNERIVLTQILRGIKVPSLYKYFLEFHNGEKTIADLSLSKKS